MSRKPLFAGRSIAFASLIAVIVLRRRAVSARIRAQLSAVVAFDDLRGNLGGQVAFAFLAQTRTARNDERPFEQVHHPAIRARRRLIRRRLAAPAQGIAYPTTTGHESPSFHDSKEGGRGESLHGEHIGEAIVTDEDACVSLSKAHDRTKGADGARRNRAQDRPANGRQLELT